MTRYSRNYNRIPYHLDGCRAIESGVLV